MIFIEPHLNLPFRIKEKLTAKKWNKTLNIQCSITTTNNSFNEN